MVSSQLGSGRSTLGMVIASIVKAAQMIQKLNKMVEAGMAERSWADNIIKSKFEEGSMFLASLELLTELKQSSKITLKF